ncbi:MAG: cation:proton antiporter [Clostridia bacterium]|nr:cation:proton antiporter [Clostridia bacterium]
MEVLLPIAIAIIAGLLMTRVVKPLGLPAVTAYLVLGVLIGPYCLGRIGVPGLGFNTMEAVEQMSIISQVALGFIAFSIGSEFRLSELKTIGRQAVIVGIVQALVACLFVDIALVGLFFILGPEKMPIPVAITLGAIATATAPAATLMVVRQYKAKGKLTSLLLPVVALDDAVGLVVFAISFGVARTLQSGSANVMAIIFEPLIEIVLSLGLGTVMGIILTHIEKMFNSNSNRLSLVIGFTILTVALSMIKFEVAGLHCGFSSLLVCMMMGTIFCNICPLSEDLMVRAEKWTAPLNVLFFVVSGAELELSVFSDVTILLIGVVYILFRSLGKYFGAFGSCKLAGCDDSVTKYLGITLLPQAGVALGMTLTAASLGGFEASIIRNVVLFSVLIYELFGPVLTKNALMKAGDIQPKSEDVINRRQRKLEAAAAKKAQANG